jgi:hypothetical protein
MPGERLILTSPHVACYKSFVFVAWYLQEV